MDEGDEPTERGEPADRAMKKTVGSRRSTAPVSAPQSGLSSGDTPRASRSQARTSAVSALRFWRRRVWMGRSPSASRAAARCITMLFPAPEEPITAIMPPRCSVSQRLCSSWMLETRSSCRKMPRWAARMVSRSSSLIGGQSSLSCLRECWAMSEPIQLMPPRPSTSIAVSWVVRWAMV